MNKLAQLLVSIPRSLDNRFSRTSIAVAVFPFIFIVLLPTGFLNGNEEYHFQFANFFWSAEQADFYAVIPERKPHLFLSTAILAPPVKLLGYELANALLRLVVACALAIGFAAMASSWKLSALDSLLTVSLFVAVGQEFFGGEWIFRSVEAKVFAYACVFFALGFASVSQWKRAILSVVIATYFHFLVGGFWALVIFGVMYLSQSPRNKVVRSFLVYLAAVAPLAFLIGWQILNGQIGDSEINPSFVRTVLRNPHHVAPFSDPRILMAWADGIVLLMGTVAAAVVALELDINAKTKNLLRLLILLGGYLCAALIISTTDIAVRWIGSFFVFRPSSLTLLIAIGALFVLLRQLESPRLLVWMMAWLIFPIAVGSEIKGKITEVLRNDVMRTELISIVESVRNVTEEDEVVLIQPGRDSAYPETALTRLLTRSTLVSWKFPPVASENVVVWYEREKFRGNLFENGCKEPLEYPVGALIVRNVEMPAAEVLDTCGPIVWQGDHYSIVDVQ